MKIQETVRDDGLRIISGRIPSKKVFVQLVAGVGSAYDPPQKQGLFHYFEHMAFKGTAGRNLNELKAFMGRNILGYNAYTDKTETVYYGSAIAGKFGRLCDFLCDIYFNSSYPSDEIEREKEVVLNEIARGLDNDEYAAFFAFWENLYKDNPLRIFGVGTPDGVNNVSRDDLIAARNYWYVPSNTVIIAVGNVNHGELVSAINQRVPLGSQSAEHKTWADEYDIFPENVHTVIEKPDRKKAIVIYGCKFPLFKDNRTNTIRRFLEKMLVSGSNSILWDEIREKRGLAYTVSGGVSGEYSLGYYFYVCVETLPQRISEVKELVCDFVHKPIINYPILLEETREHLSDWNYLEHEQLKDWANLIWGRVERCYSPKVAERYFKKLRDIIKGVTLEEIEALRSEVFKPERFTAVILKP